MVKRLWSTVLPKQPKVGFATPSHCSSSRSYPTTDEPKRIWRDLLGVDLARFRLRAQGDRCELAADVVLLVYLLHLRLHLDGQRRNTFGSTRGRFHDEERLWQQSQHACDCRDERIFQSVEMGVLFFCIPSIHSGLISSSGTLIRFGVGARAYCGA